MGVRKKKKTTSNTGSAAPGKRNPPRRGTSSSTSRKTKTAAAPRPARASTRSAPYSPADYPEESQPDSDGIRTISRARILPYLAGTMLIAASVLVFIVYRSYAWPAFIAALFYVGFDQVNRRFLRLFNGGRNRAATATTLLVVAVVLGPLFFLVQHLVVQAIDLVDFARKSLTGNEIMNLIQEYPVLTQYITREPFFWVNLTSSYEGFIQEYSKYLEADKMGDWLGNAYKVVQGGITATAGVTINIMLALIMLFFMFRDGPTFYKFLEDALPFPRNITSRFTERMREILIAVIRGNVFVSILQGTAVGSGLWIAGLPNGIIFGFIAGILSLIPFGPAVVWAPAALYLIFVKGSFGWGLFMIIWCVGLYMILENILKPKILDRKLGIHPLFLFLAILGGLAEFGITGVVLGPLIVTLFMTIWSIYHIWDTPAGESPDDT